MFWNIERVSNGQQKIEYEPKSYARTKTNNEKYFGYSHQFPKEINTKVICINDKVDITLKH